MAEAMGGRGGGRRHYEGHESQGRSKVVARRTTESSMPGSGRRKQRCGSEELGLLEARRRATETSGRELLRFGT